MITFPPDNHAGKINLYKPTTVGKMLGARPYHFTKWLREDAKVLYRKGKNLRARLRYENRGYFVYETTGNEDQSFEQVYFTDSGLQWIERIYKERINGNT